MASAKRSHSFNLCTGELTMNKFETKWNELYESQRNMQLKRRFTKWGKQNQKSKRRNENYKCLPNLTERQISERKDNRWKIS